MNTIAVIGAGNLGGRHLQALSMLKEPAKLYVVDIAAASLERARSWFLEKRPGEHLQLTLCSDLGELPESLDLVVAATSSDVRAALTERLLAEKRVRYLILEKVLFQREADYARIADVIQRHGCKAWVNCPRRTAPFYQDLAVLLRDETHVRYSVAGGEWGLGCNAVHFLDLLALLTGDTDFTLDARGLDREILESKRAGFKEFTGSVTGTSARCGAICLTAEKGASAPPLITLSSPHFCCSVKEFEGRALLMRAANGWEAEEHTLGARYQSELTGIVAEEILATDGCRLTPYAESVPIHLSFIRALLRRINENENGKEGTAICPIT